MPRESLQALFRCHGGPLYVASSGILGLLGAVASNLSASGIAIGSIPVVTAVTIIWMIAIPLVELLSAQRPLTVRIFRAVSGLIAIPVLVGAIWSASAWILPDAGKLYFWINQSTIEAGWKRDPRTDIIYFPLRYAVVAQGALKVPQYFIVLDKEHQLKFVPFSNQLSAPSCPEAKYSARRLDENVFLLVAFADSASAPFFPCLITPIPAVSSNNG